MATRSRIAIENADGTFTSVYCHWDGYPSHNGQILFDCYNTHAEVRELLSYGGLSVLGPKIGTKHDFESRDAKGQCTFYKRDRGEEDEGADKSDTYADLCELTRESGGEWLYVFGRDGVWRVAQGGTAWFGGPADDAPGGLRLLEDVLNKVDA